MIRASLIPNQNIRREQHQNSANSFVFNQLKQLLAVRSQNHKAGATRMHVNTDITETYTKPVRKQ